MKSINIGYKSIKLQLLYTAGTEKFRSITTGYYRGADAAFVVFDLSSKSSFKNLNEWIESYYKYSNPDVEKNVVLIGNKSDLVDKRVVTEEEIVKFIKDNNINYFETSAKDGKNIDECFNFIAEKLMNQNAKNEKNEKNEKNDIIRNEKLKENVEVIIGQEKRCCFD